MIEQIKIMFEDFIQNVKMHLIIPSTIEYTNSCLVSLVKTNKNIIRNFKMKYHNLIKRDVQIFWMYDKDFEEIVQKMVCSECLNGLNKFINIITGFSRCCCAKCSQSSEQTRIKRDITNKNKTNDEKQLICEKRKKTCLEKYGVENTFQSKEIQQKIEKTCLEKYGTKRACQSDIVKDIIKQTMVERYNEVSYAKTSEYKRRMKEYYNSDEFLNKIHKYDDETQTIDGKIYKITNLINNKVYIGQTTRTIQQRFDEHSKINRRYHNLIQRAIQKYGVENFKIEHIDSAITYKELNQKEKEWVIKENCIAPFGYNLCLGGYNKGVSDESKERMKLSHLNKVSNIKDRKHYFHFKTGEHRLFKVDDNIPDGFVLGNPSARGKYYRDEFGSKKLKRE